MEGRIRGSFPGGPSREGTSESRERASRLHRREEQDARLAGRSLRRGRRSRRRRMVLGVLLSVVVAGGVGLAMGLSSRRSAEEILAQQRAAERPSDLQISREVNRTLLELWRMEEVEAQRNRR